MQVRDCGMGGRYFLAAGRQAGRSAAALFDPDRRHLEAEDSGIWRQRTGAKVNGTRLLNWAEFVWIVGYQEQYAPPSRRMTVRFPVGLSGGNLH